MDCPARARGKTELLADYCAGRLDAATFAAVREHIASCPDCKAWTERQADVWAALDAWRLPEVSPGFDEKLLARIDAEQERSRFWLWHWRPAVSLAAAALLLIAVLVIRPGGSVPRPAQVAPTVKSESLDPDRLEKALDDVDMLRQLGSM